ncbi:MAG: hypothetical protein IJ087_10970 [Eggerthellaceae bacterium]|nr:hypothetical protein [Eggerthellaceae bacterium]
MRRPSTDQEIAAAVLEVFDTLNRALFGGGLPCPGFALDDFAEILGAETLAIFYTPEEIPALEKPAIFIDLPGVDKVVVAGFADSWKRALADTMLHELVHYHCYLQGIADHDEKGVHTDSYRDEARAHGLNCEWRDGGGWSVTEISTGGWESIARVLDGGEARLAGWD